MIETTQGKFRKFQSSPNRGRVSDLQPGRPRAANPPVSVLSKSRMGSRRLSPPLVQRSDRWVSVLSKSRMGLGRASTSSIPRNWGGFSPLKIEDGSRTHPQKFVMQIKGLQGRLHFVGFVIAILPAFIFECRSEPRCFANDFIALHVLHFLDGGMRVSTFQNRKCKTVAIRSFI